MPKPATRRCQDLQLQLEKDQSSLVTAQAAVPTAQAQAQQSINTAQSNVNAAQAAVNLAVNQEGAANVHPVISAAVEQAQANLNQAQSQLALWLSRPLQQATLVTPDSGTVAEVYGAVGEYVGPDGVRRDPAPRSPSLWWILRHPALPVAATTPSGGSSTTSGFEPLIEIVGGAQQVMAQVPAVQCLRTLPFGRTAHVYIPALHLTVPGGWSTGGRAEPNPGGQHRRQLRRDNETKLDHTVGGLLPGMSATVRP